MDSKRRHLAAIVVLLFALSACNLPTSGTPTQSRAGAIYTAAAQTVEAQLTQVSQPPATAGQTPGSPPIPSDTPLPGVLPSDTSLPPTAPPPITATPVPASPTPVPCDRVKFVKDVTYPDDTAVDSGTTFVKTWRLKNEGSCTWTSGYNLVFISGDSMNASASVQLTTGAVAPGETVDASVTLTAPDTGGTYRGEWKLRNAADVIFGLGDNNKAFWVQIKVGVISGIGFDFLVQASSAAWTGSIGSNPGTPLTFDGDDNDPNGVAKIKDNLKLENGATSGKVLLTYPKHDNDGVVSGLFPAYTVQNGDHFKARLGFWAQGGICGAGKVKYQLVYSESGSLHLLGEWSKTCDGKLLAVDVNLSSLKGKTIQFGFILLADGAFQDDWAIWNSPRVEN